MVQVRVNDFVGTNLDEMIVVTGLPRSGTTILGKLIGSFDTVEYAFEPPLIAYLDAKRRHDLIESEVVAEYLEIYLFFDYFAEHLHGRRYNFRPNDASYILDMHSLPEIHQKWQDVATMDDAVSVAPDYTFSVKFPGVYHALSAFYERSSHDIRIVDIGRNLDRVLASLVGKRWFFDENLGPDATGLWPFHDCEGEFLVPYLVEEDDTKWWQSINPETRTVYICNRLAEDRLAFEDEYGDDENYHRIRYERLVDNPDQVTTELTETLGVEQGIRTQSVVDEIESTTAPIATDEVLDQCDEPIKEQFLDIRSDFIH